MKLRSPPPPTPLYRPLLHDEDEHAARLLAEARRDSKLSLAELAGQAHGANGLAPGAGAERGGGGGGNGHDGGGGGGGVEHREGSPRSPRKDHGAIDFEKARLLGHDEYHDGASGAV